MLSAKNKPVSGTSTQATPTLLDDSATTPSKKAGGNAGARPSSTRQSFADDKDLANPVAVAKPIGPRSSKPFHKLTVPEKLTPGSSNGSAVNEQVPAASSKRKKQRVNAGQGWGLGKSLVAALGVQAMVQPVGASKNALRPDAYLSLGPNPNVATGEPQFVSSGFMESLDASRQKKADYKVPSHKVGVNPRTQYSYARNLVAPGPEGMIMTNTSPWVISEEMHLPAVRIKRVLDHFKYPVNVLNAPVNLANVAFDKEKDLLVIAHSSNAIEDCNLTTDLHPDCADKVGEVVTAFGTPQNIIQLFMDPSKKIKDFGSDACYDLDVFFHLTTRPDKIDPDTGEVLERGKKLALLHTPCLMEDAASEAMTRKGVMEQLKALDIDIIEIDEGDFRNLAANAVTPAPGSILFTADISNSLKEQLKDKDMDPVVPQDGKVLGELGGPRPYGIHCVMVELVGKPEGEEPGGSTLGGTALKGASMALAALAGKRLWNKQRSPAEEPVDAKADKRSEVEAKGERETPRAADEDTSKALITARDMALSRVVHLEPSDAGARATEFFSPDSLPRPGGSLEQAPPRQRTTANPGGHTARLSTPRQPTVAIMPPDSAGMQPSGSMESVLNSGQAVTRTPGPHDQTSNRPGLLSPDSAQASHEGSLWSALNRPPEG